MALGKVHHINQENLFPRHRLGIDRVLHHLQYNQITITRYNQGNKQCYFNSETFNLVYKYLKLYDYQLLANNFFIL